ncbi:MAG: hypothetical protein LBQ78_08440 [Tannerellaceae bacterium]|jgi:hypothetical protein|nr:hypothetical protein [Tannerellaceae bacterium]
MKRDIKIKTLWILSALLLVSGVRAQVVIGSSLTPSEPAASLQIKEYDAPAGSGGATADKGGLLLPRVELKSLSDITVIPANAGKDKLANLTGLLIYNVNTSNLDEGIYEWDGTRWYFLEPISEISGSSSRKTVVRGNFTTAAAAPLLRMGIFEFRLTPSTDVLNRIPQFRLLRDVPSPTVFWYSVTRFWDYNEINSPNRPIPQVGYSFDVKGDTISPVNSREWRNVHKSPLKKEDQRYEVYLADPIYGHLYRVQFLIFQSALKPAYIILATEY